MSLKFVLSLGLLTVAFGAPTFEDDFSDYKLYVVPSDTIGEKVSIDELLAIVKKLEVSMKCT